MKHYTMYNWDKFTGDPISEASQVKQPPHFLWPCEHEEEKLLREKSQKSSWQDPCWKRNLGTTMSSSVSKFFLLTKKEKWKKKAKQPANQLSHSFPMMNSCFQRSPPTPPSASTQQPYSTSAIFYFFTSDFLTLLSLHSLPFPTSS